MGSYRNLSNSFSDHNAAEASGKRLLVHMGVVQNSCRYDIALSIDNFPFVGVVLPSGISVRDFNGEVVDSVSPISYLDVVDVGLSRIC